MPAQLALPPSSKITPETMQQKAPPAQPLPSLPNVPAATRPALQAKKKSPPPPPPPPALMSQRVGADVPSPSTAARPSALDDNTETETHAQCAPQVYVSGSDKEDKSGAEIRNGARRQLYAMTASGVPEYCSVLVSLMKVRSGAAAHPLNRHVVLLFVCFICSDSLWQFVSECISLCNGRSTLCITWRLDDCLGGGRLQRVRSRTVRPCCQLPHHRHHLA